MSKTFSFRIREELILAARELDISVTELIEYQLQILVKHKQCPVCKQAIKSKIKKR